MCQQKAERPVRAPPHSSAAYHQCTSGLPKNALKMDPCSPLVCLIEHVVGDILDVVRAETLPKCRHGAIAVGHLLDDRRNFVLAIGDKSLFLDLLLGHDAVVAISMASSAVSREDSCPPM